MGTEVDLLAAKLRGKLAPKGPGARGLERVARNPDCLRLRALVAVGVAPATAARDVYGVPIFEGISPFAIGAGVKFEHLLLKGNASSLASLFQKAGLLMPCENKVAFVASMVRRSRSTDAATHRRIVDEILSRKLRRDAETPNLVIKPRLFLPFLGREHEIEPDALVSSDGDAFYSPVELKSFPDRGGKTDPADVRSACRQAAVAVLALRHAVSKLGGADPGSLVPAAADLVFRRPGSFQGVVYRMSLAGEVESLERLQKEGAETIAEVEGLLGAGVAMDTPEALNRIANHYVETCRDHCALAPVCKKQAVDSGDPVILGSRAAEYFADAGSLDRVLELLRDRGLPPRTAEEKRLQEDLQEAYRAYRKAVDDGD